MWSASWPRIGSPSPRWADAPQFQGPMALGAARKCYAWRMLRDPMSYLHDVRDPEGRYTPQAIRLVVEGVLSALAEEDVPVHLSAHQVTEGLVNRAADQFGLLASEVLGSWGLRTGRDVGEVVGILVAWGVLAMSEDDRLEDFDDFGSLDTELKRTYRIGAPAHS